MTENGTEKLDVKFLTQEIIKGKQEVAKQIITISSSSIVLLVSFIEKLFPNPEWKILVAACLICFVFAILLFLMAQDAMASMISGALLKDIGMIDSFQAAMSYQAKFVSRYNWGGFFFISGLISLVIFGVKNLF